MNRWYDEADPRVQADRLHEINNQPGMAKFIHAKGQLIAGARRDAVSRALRDKATKENLALKGHITDQARRVKPTMLVIPKGKTV